MPFEELPHTADAMFRITSDRIEGLFEDAARAMFQLMYGSCVLPAPTLNRVVTVVAGDHEMLVAAFLSELLYMAETEGIVLCDARVHLDGTNLTADVQGEAFHREHHHGREIKGISLSGLRIYKQQEIYVLDIIFDV